MPQVPPSTLTDIKHTKQRNELQKNLFEREVLSYHFSYKRLAALIQSLDGDVDDLHECILAYTDEEEKEQKERLNGLIEPVLKAYNITSFRGEDPFGRPKDVLLYPSKSSSFAQTRAIAKASKYGIDASSLAELFADKDVTIKKDITVLTVKDHAETENEKTAKA